MNKNLQFYKRFRPHSHLTIWGLINQMLSNRILKSSILSSILPPIYNLAIKFPGKYIANWLVCNTLARAYTGGSDVQKLYEKTSHLRDKGIPLIIDYYGQSIRNKVRWEDTIDNNYKNYLKSINEGSKYSNNIVSIRLSRLMNLNLFEKDKIWNEYNIQGKLTAQRLFDAYYKIYSGISTQDIINYLKIIHNIQQNNYQQFEINQINFKINHQPYYLYQQQKNNNFIIKLSFTIDQKEKTSILTSISYINQIVNQQINHHHNRIIIQTQSQNIQRAIDSISQQIQIKYNSLKPYIINTIDAYSQDITNRLDFQLQTAKISKIHSAIKLSKQAIITRQTNSKQTPAQHLAAKNAHLSNFKTIMNKDINGCVMIQVNDDKQLNQCLNARQKCVGLVDVQFWQHYGMSGYLSYYLIERRQRVYQHIIWSQDEILSSKLIQNISNYSHIKQYLDLDYKLIKQQLYNRTISL